LAQGELAVNLADEALYTKDASNAVVKLNAPSIDDKNTGATKHVTIDTSGNVGIGTSSPGANSALRIEKNNGYLSVSSNVGSGGATNPSGTTGINFGWNRSNGDGESNIVWGKPGALAGYLQFAMWDGTTYSERARIDSSGNLLVGTTSANGVGWTASPNGSGQIRSSGTESQDKIQFANSNGVVGAITTNGSSTSYFTSSDYRLKEGIAPMVGALATVTALKPVTYKWKIDGSDGQGFIAHELQAVVPDCVTGEKDAVDAEGNPQYQGIDTSFLVATLTAAIQEQQDIIASLTARVEALEAKK
jgi:hypothetical protein